MPHLVAQTAVLVFCLMGYTHGVREQAKDIGTQGNRKWNIYWTTIKSTRSFFFNIPQGENSPNNKKHSQFYQYLDIVCVLRKWFEKVVFLVLRHSEALCSYLALLYTYFMDIKRIICRATAIWQFCSLIWVVKMMTKCIDHNLFRLFPFWNLVV